VVLTAKWRPAAVAAAAAIIATTALGAAAAGPAAARPIDNCRFARNNLVMYQHMLDDAHARGDAESIAYWRSQVFDAQISVLDAC
jgi:hypothetical protein